MYTLLHLLHTEFKLIINHYIIFHTVILSILNYVFGNIFLTYKYIQFFISYHRQFINITKEQCEVEFGSGLPLEWTWIKSITHDYALSHKTTCFSFHVIQGDSNKKFIFFTGIFLKKQDYIFEFC